MSWNKDCKKGTPEKQKPAADNFFQALGWILLWWTFYSNDSIDAKSLGCAFCGMKEYDNISPQKREKIFSLQLGQTY